MITMNYILMWKKYLLVKKNAKTQTPQERMHP